MLIHINPAHSGVEVVAGTAHIVVSIDKAGKSTLRSFFCDRFDASYARMPEDRLLERELPKLLRELREQVQASSGSATTE